MTSVNRPGMSTAAALLNLKINMDRLATTSSSSFCSIDDTDEVISTPTPASPSASATDIAAKNHDDKLPTDNAAVDKILNHEDVHDCDYDDFTARTSLLNERSDSSGNGSNDYNNNKNATSPLSHDHKIRLLYFFFRFSTGCLVPFMSLYMQHVGMRPDQIGTLQAIRPIVTMTSAPLWGGLADRTGRKKSVLAVR